MPSKNILKTFSPNSYYHVYNRGVEKKNILLDDADKSYFLSLFARHLDPNNEQRNVNNLIYPKYNDALELLSYCIMDNHYHLLLWQGDMTNSITGLMRSIGTAYTMYYNKKYERVGPLFQSRYKASRITSDEHLIHITRYIHLNPGDPLQYRFSSLRAYYEGANNRWLLPQRVLEIFGNEKYA